MSDEKAVTLLLVEDDEVTRHELGELMTREGFTVHLAANGLAGWEAFERERPEIVIADLKMPGIDGLELMDRVKAASQPTPVILITAYGDTDTAVEALRTGALDYFKKPIDLDELLDAVGRAKEVALGNRATEQRSTILLAEDEPITRRHLAEVLEKEGWHVLRAEDGEVAVALFERNPVDILLLDVKMPKMDGLKALADMRSRRRDFEAIILTGYGDESIAIQALRNGAAGFLRKPVDLEELLAVLDKAKERVMLRRALRHRTREVHLAEQIIALISEDGEVALQLSASTLADAKSKGKSALDRLGDAVAVLDVDRNLLVSNAAMTRLLGGQPERFDDQAAQALADRSQGELTVAQIQQCLAGAQHGPIGTTETVGAPGGAGLMCVRIRIRYGDAGRDYVVVLLHGLSKAP